MNEEAEVYELALELSDENGTLTKVDLPEVQLAVTLTIHIKGQGSRNMPKLDILIDRDNAGKPYFIISNSSSQEIEA